MNARLEGQFNKVTYAYQEKVKDCPLIKAWIGRVEKALAAMDGADVEFVTSLQDRSEDNRIYHDHDYQRVATFMKPVLASTEGADCMDEECLPYYRIRFQDGVEIIADDGELFSHDPRFTELISAVSGAFAVSRDLGFVGPWHLAADGTDSDKSAFMEGYSTLKLELRAPRKGPRP